MTEAAFCLKRTRFAVSVEGHADYDAAGRDIVCAAVSMLVQALASWVQKNAAHIKQVTAFTVEAGAVCIDVEAHPQHREAVRTALDLILCGFELLQERYPQHVRVTRDRQGDE